MEEWPKPKKGMSNKTLEDEFEVAQEAITALLNSREKAGVRLRWPISMATIEVNDDSVENRLLKLASMMEDCINSKHLVVKRVKEFGKEIRPVFTEIGPEFKESAPIIAEALKNEEADKVLSSVSKNGYYPLHTTNGVFNIKAGHFSIVDKLESPNAVTFKHGIAYIDKEVSEELWEEAMVREFERRIQMARKDANLKKADRIVLFYDVDAAYSKIIRKNAKEIARYVNAKEMHEGIKDAGRAKEYEMDEKKVLIEIERA